MKKISVIVTTAILSVGIIAPAISASNGAQSASSWGCGGRRC